MTVTIQGGSDRAFGVVVRRSAEIGRRAVREIQAEGERVISETVYRVPDSRGFVGRVDTGKAAQAVQLGPLVETPEKISGAVVVEGPPADYWPVIEGGRRPGKPVSLAGRFRIQTWVRRKILPRAVANLRLEKARASVAAGRAGFGAGLTGKAPKVSKDERAELLDSLTFLVVRAIRKRGTPGLFPFRRAAVHLRSGVAVGIYRRIAGGAAGAA